MGWEAVGWQLKARAGSPWIPGIDPYPPPSREQGCCVVGSWEPGSRRGRGGKWGRGCGGAHIRRVYPPGSSNSPSRHSPSISPELAAGPSSGQPAGEDPQLGPQGPLPTHLLGIGVLKVPVPGLLTPRRVHSLGPASGAGGQDRGKEEISPGRPLSLGLAERVSLSRKGGSGSLQNTIRRGMRDGPQTPRAVPRGRRGRGR